MLKADGLDLDRPDLGVALRILEGLDQLPGVRGEDDVVPFLDGRVPVERIPDVRPLVLGGVITDGAIVPGPLAPAGAQMRAYVDQVKAVLSPTRTTPVLLVRDLEDGSPRWIYAFPRNIMSDPRNPEYRPVSIELEAIDPYWYGPVGASYLDAGLFLDDGWSLDSSGEIVIVPTSTIHTVLISNPGTAAAKRVRVELDGPSVGAVGIEVAGASPVGFLHPALVAGQTLVVDNFARTVLLGAVPVREDLTLLEGNRHGEYLRLPPGASIVRVLGQPAEARLLYTATYQ